MKSIDNSLRFAPESLKATVLTTVFFNFVNKSY